MTVMKSDPLKAFRQHGFIQTTTSGDTQEVGACPFCGKEKFFINVNTKAWDCKVCGKSGGYKSFLRDIVAHCQEHFKDDVALALSEDRGIGIEALQRRCVGYNPVTQKYTIPVPDQPALEMWNVLTHQPGGKLISTSGCTVGLFGWDQDIDGAETIWLCEGEWDGMAWMETLTALGRSRDIALAVPGAGTFKAEWTGIFKDKVVRVLYDHDKAGRDGAKKVYAAIKRLVKDIKFLHWPEDSDLPEGFDVRDLCQKFPKNAETVFAYVEDRLQDMPPGVDLSALSDPDSASLQRKYTGLGMPAEEAYKAYRKWLDLPDNTILDFMFGAIIANRLQGDPVWVFIVGPPSCGKSDLLMSISAAADIYATTSMTPRSLISGTQGPGGSDPSLIPKLNGKVLCIKDFTTILDMNPIDREQIWSILRDAYDGECKRTFGNGVVRDYKSKFGLIAGVTHAIETHALGQTALGERFLRFPFPKPTTDKEERTVARKSLGNQEMKDQMKKELGAAGTAILDFDFGEPPPVPEEITDRIIYCAQFTARMRATVTRDKYSKEVVSMPSCELPMRLSNQYYKLARGIAMFRRQKEVGEYEFRLIQSITQGTVPTFIEPIVKGMFQNGPEKNHSIRSLAEKAKVPLTSCTRITEDLKMLGIIEPVPHSGPRPEFKLTPEFITIIQGTGLYKAQKEKHANAKK